MPFDGLTTQHTAGYPLLFGIPPSYRNPLQKPQISEEKSAFLASLAMRQGFKKV